VQSRRPMGSDYAAPPACDLCCVLVQGLKAKSPEFLSAKSAPRLSWLAEASAPSPVAAAARKAGRTPPGEPTGDPGTHCAPSHAPSPLASAPSPVAVAARQAGEDTSRWGLGTHCAPSHVTPPQWRLTQGWSRSMAGRVQCRRYSGCGTVHASSVLRR